MTDLPLIPASESIAKCSRCDADLYFDADIRSCPIHQPQDCPLRGADWAWLKKKIVTALGVFLCALFLSYSSSDADMISTPGYTVSVTPTVTASANYSAGNEVGGLLNFQAAGLSNTYSGVILSAQITVKTVQTGEFDLYLCDSNPTASSFSDKGAPSIAAADVTKCKWFIPFTAVKSGLGTHSVYYATGLGIEFYLPQASGTSFQTSIYGVLVTPGAPSAQFGTTTDVTVSLGLLQD